MDYVLHARVEGRNLPIALLEAKAENHPPAEGLEQAKGYGRQHHVPFVFATNGHLFVEHDFESGKTTSPDSLEQFPTWEELLQRWAKHRKIDLKSEGAAPLTRPSRDGDRYYQRAAVRAVLETIAAGENRALLSLATGTGKTRIAVSLLRALRDAGQLRRALFLCDRDTLRTQALGALSNEFKSDAAKATTRNPEKNARVIVATYQTLGIDGEDGDASFLTEHYPENYFSHIIIDECHRSAWGKWRTVLDRNPDAVHIGLTATPRTFLYATEEDERIHSDNHAYFGQPVYEYSIAQAMEDGYLAAMRLVTSDIITAGLRERDQGVERDRLTSAKIRDAKTGKLADIADLATVYAPGALEERLMLPDRVKAMCADLFKHLLATGGPLQKTLIFCARDDHADRVATAMNNLYADWAAEEQQKVVDPYAFKCTGRARAPHLADLKGAARRAFVACTVDLISTGVDVPRLQNIVYFRYLKSPITFHQMLGRGTRLHEESGKRHFTVYDYTNATRLMDSSLAQPAPSEEPQQGAGSDLDPVRIFQADGVEVRIEPDGAAIMIPGAGGALERVSLDEYRKRVAESLLSEVEGLADFRERWIEPGDRRDLIDSLPEGSNSVGVLRAASGIDDTCDEYDVLAHSLFDETVRERLERADRFEERSGDEQPVLFALARQFAYGGTTALESLELFNVPAIRDAGGVKALGVEPGAALRDLKRDVLATDDEWPTS
jgi:type I restriction enzyme R subunit